jgi:hypothetical protein
MSVPDPAMAVKLPPTNPVPTSNAPFQKQKLGIDSYVFRLYCLKWKETLFSVLIEKIEL